ncbi:response regulator [Algoriphagus jejuensis]|uniref:Response regulator n=1 Tax=Algoriphagus jejuensis TaxID=419934 RepID=A0ABP3YBI9_9BACT
MKDEKFNILLADDDPDDRMFFQDALDELSIQATLSEVTNGSDLMKFLENNLNKLPDVLFLDLNMPSKSGMECLSEIKKHEKLSQIPVLIYSTSANPEVVEILYNMGALYYIRKEGDFSCLKAVIGKALFLCRNTRLIQPERPDFLILVDDIRPKLPL